jgi:hypothetical protein
MQVPWIVADSAPPCANRAVFQNQRSRHCIFGFAILHKWKQKEMQIVMHIIDARQFFLFRRSGPLRRGPCRGAAEKGPKRAAPVRAAQVCRKWWATHDGGESHACSPRDAAGRERAHGVGGARRVAMLKPGRRKAPLSSSKQAIAGGSGSGVAGARFASSIDPCARLQPEAGPLRCTPTQGPGTILQASSLKCARQKPSGHLSQAHGNGSGHEGRQHRSTARRGAKKNAQRIQK